MNVIVSRLSSGFHVGVNLNAFHIALPTFAQERLYHRDSSNRDDLNLTIEVAEHEPLDMDEDLVQRLDTLHENGFMIALNDFDTGYFGLSYLYDPHIDYIKIDQDFVGKVNELPDSARILDCAPDLTRKLSLSIVAEGIETKVQLDYLNKNNVVSPQGYYFYKPIIFTELAMIPLSKPKAEVFAE